MRKTHFEASAVIDARPEDVYAVIADYRNGHPYIVPKELLYGMEVEAGGWGAGTIIHYKMRAFGSERLARAIVSEPEPGKVLVEAQTTSSLATTFTVTPVGDGQQSLVQIATKWEASPTLRGAIEQAFYPFVMKRSYPKELSLLAAFMKSKQAASV